MKIYFPEYKDALGKVDGAFSMELLKTAPFPEELKALVTEGIRQIWQESKLKGRGYNRAAEILKYAEKSVGLKEGAEAARLALKHFAHQILELNRELAALKKKLNQNIWKYRMWKISFRYQGSGITLSQKSLLRWGMYRDLTMSGRYRN